MIGGAKGERACEFTSGGILLGCGLAPPGVIMAIGGLRNPLVGAEGQERPLPRLHRIVRKWLCRLDISIGH